VGRGSNQNYGAVNFQISGDKECSRNLRILGEKALSAVVKAAHAAAKPVIADARSLVPVRFGFLKKSIGVKVRRYKKNRIAVAVIGARTGMGGTATNPVTGKPMKIDPSKYLHLVEFGTDPHWLPTSLHGGRITRKPARHPGSKGVHFLKTAFDNNKENALQRARDIIEEECRKALV
jgi:HK97 gp10 family phage protein